MVERHEPVTTSAASEAFVRVGVARDEGEAARWVTALARVGIEADVEIADGAELAPGRTAWVGQFFVYPVLVANENREEAERVLGALLDAPEGQHVSTRAIMAVSLLIGTVLLVVVSLVARGNGG